MQRKTIIRKVESHRNQINSSTLAIVNSGKVGICIEKVPNIKISMNVHLLKQPVKETRNQTWFGYTGKDVVAPYSPLPALVPHQMVTVPHHLIFGLSKEL